MTEVGARGELESVRVAGILRDDIILGRRMPGSRLIERDIAAELQVSRLPVREAIRSLAAEGIVVSRPRTWATVRQFSAQDITEFAEVREAVETLLFVLAAERHDDVGFARLQDVVDRQADAVRRGDEEAAHSTAGEFHLLVATLAGNAMLLELVAGLLTRLRWMFAQHHEPGVMLDDHRGLLEAIRLRDTDALRVLVPAHLASGVNATRRQLAEDSV